MKSIYWYWYVPGLSKSHSSDSGNHLQIESIYNIFKIFEHKDCIDRGEIFTNKARITLAILNVGIVDQWRLEIFDTIYLDLTNCRIQKQSGIYIEWGLDPTHDEKMVYNEFFMLTNFFKRKKRTPF